jgi:hypothetical protein
MSDSIQQLQVAIDALHKSYEAGETGASFKSISDGCGSISSDFSGVNGKLLEGWDTTSNLFKQLGGMVDDIISEMHLAMNKFTSGTLQAEMTANNAVERSNEVAQGILNRLDAFNNLANKGNSGNSQFENNIRSAIHDKFDDLKVDELAHSVEKESVQVGIEAADSMGSDRYNNHEYYEYVSAPNPNDTHNDFDRNIDY